MSTKKIVICEYADGRTLAFRHWLPESVFVRRNNGEKVPDSFDVIIFGGGPMSAYTEDREKYPFLGEDFQLIRSLSANPLTTGPLLVGICLGAQLMSLALGGTVVKAKFVRGWNHIQPCKKHVIYPPGTAEVIQFEFHSNHIVSLPSNAELIASSDEDVIEAFTIGNRILATAYHPEVRNVDAQRIYSGAGLTSEELHNDCFADPGESSVRASQNFFNFILT